MTRLFVIDIQVLEFLSLGVFGNSIHFSLDLDAFSEIDEQAYLNTGRLEIVDQLGTPS
jgi:hypothetical protein